MGPAGVAKKDPNGSNCEHPVLPPMPVLEGCESTPHGCCPGSDDAKDDAEGSNCCLKSKYGCCGGMGPAGVAKKDADGSNCEHPVLPPMTGGCGSTAHGCCPGSHDAKDDAEGSNCCRSSKYGCCPYPAGVAKKDPNGSNCEHPVLP